MNRHQPNAVAYYTFPTLERYGEVVHALTTRHGGVSTGPYTSLNLSSGLGDDPCAVGENLRRALAAVGIRREEVVSPHQRHTAHAAPVGTADRGTVVEDADVLVTADVDVALVLRFADCAPILIYDPARRAIAVAHSGWRGTVQGATRVAVDLLARHFGSRPGDLVAAIGPCIGPCCYEVGDEVVARVRAVFDRAEALLPERRNRRRHFDLWAANRRWLEEAGVREVEVAAVCTACRTDEFYSYRAARGQTGHFAAMMVLRDTGRGK